MRKSRLYDPQLSPDLYLQKIARVKAVYLSEEEAYRIAKEQANKWSQVFESKYAKIHNDPDFRNMVFDVCGDATAGLCIAVANFYLARSIYTYQVLPIDAVAYGTGRIGVEETATRLYVGTFITASKYDQGLYNDFRNEMPTIVSAYVNGDYETALDTINARMANLKPKSRVYAGYSGAMTTTAMLTSPSQTNEGRTSIAYLLDYIRERRIV